jgi:hypothetical protein
VMRGEQRSRSFGVMGVLARVRMHGAMCKVSFDVNQHGAQYEG